ncbi:hypothetical protein WT56_02025 [Burkholderia pseudomultivorans]|uniref:Pyocin activator protein PrtN n=2 Tax=Burkholderia pseudomultivorans TaxID=1207504 RepID=A0A132E8M5_9BURK|nr:hypothetical protein WT56_02025 [Burkholderia pseudomultivorans]
MIHKKDIGHFCLECLSGATFVDVHIACIVLGIDIEEIEFLMEESPDRNPDFPRPVVRRGQQVRWRVKSLIQYIEKKVKAEVESCCCLTRPHGFVAQSEVA